MSKNTEAEEEKDTRLLEPEDIAEEESSIQERDSPI